MMKAKENEDGCDKEKESEKQSKAPELMPYQIWGHITKDQWDAFVIQKTTDKVVVSIYIALT